MNTPITLQIGDTFQRAWKGCTQPMWFRVLDICREENRITVECHSYDGTYSHDEEWDGSGITEMAFETGEYKMIEP